MEFIFNTKIYIQLYPILVPEDDFFRGIQIFGSKISLDTAVKGDISGRIDILRTGHDFDFFSGKSNRMWNRPSFIFEFGLSFVIDLLNSDWSIVVFDFVHPSAELIFVFENEFLDIHARKFLAKNISLKQSKQTLFDGLVRTSNIPKLRSHGTSTKIVKLELDQLLFLPRVDMLVRNDDMFPGVAVDIHQDFPVFDKASGNIEILRVEQFFKNLTIPLHAEEFEGLTVFSSHDMHEKILKKDFIKRVPQVVIIPSRSKGGRKWKRLVEVHFGNCYMVFDQVFGGIVAKTIEYAFGKY